LAVRTKRAVVSRRRFGFERGIVELFAERCSSSEMGARPQPLGAQWRGETAGPTRNIRSSAATAAGADLNAMVVSLQSALLPTRDWAALGAGTPEQPVPDVRIRA